MIVADWMTKDPKTIDIDATLDAACKIMEAGRFRCLPVLSDGNLVGVLSDRDTKPHEAYLSRTKVNAAMTHDPTTIASGAPVEEAARILLQRKFGGLPVLDGTRLAGIITTSDILRAFLTLTGEDESGALRIGLTFTDPAQSISSLDGIIREKGGQLLSLGTFHSPADQERVYYLRILCKEPDPIVQRLREERYKIVGVWG